MTKQQKIEAWLIEQGYKEGCDCVLAVYKLESPRTGLEANSDWGIENLSKDINCPLLGIFKGTEYIKLPDFEDDVEEPKDKALVGYLIAHEYEYGCDPLGELLRAAMREINARLLALEAANEKA